MIPSRLLLAMLATWVGFSVGGVFWSPLDAAWGIAGGIIATLAALDAWRVWRIPTPEVVRDMPTSHALGARGEVTLIVRNSSTRRLAAMVHDHAPPQLAASGLPKTVRLEPQSGAAVRYAVRARARGEHTFASADLRLASPWRLWWARRRAGEPQAVHVFPDFGAVARLTLLARGDRLGRIGIHQRQRRGEGRDFYQLRDYRVGDSLRQIDWHATSRLRRAISREYRDEQDQRVIFLLDHGRRMRSLDGELSHLDHALNGMLLLAYVALRQGDAVGLMTFGGTDRWVAPRKGAVHINTLLNATFDLDSTTQVSDLYGAVEQVLTKLERRALLVVITNLRDDPDEDVVALVRLVQRKHLLLIASLREHDLVDALTQPQRDFSAAVTTAATHLYLHQRGEAHQRLRRAGAQCLDLEARQLPLRLVNQYLDIKRSGTL